MDDEKVESIATRLFLLGFHLGFYTGGGDSIKMAMTRLKNNPITIPDHIFDLFKEAFKKAREN